MKEILKLDHIQKYYGNGGNVIFVLLKGSECKFKSGD